jgi:lipoprotein-anchoring transpeptidase ErfK/SrfK
MRRAAALIAVFVVGCALGAAAFADSGPPGETTTATATTTTEPAVLPDGVTIGGVAVGGLAPADAYAAVRQIFSTPLILVFGRTRVTATPEQLGAVGYAQRAVAAAGRATPQAAIPLQISVRLGPLRRYLRGLARKLDRAAADANLRIVAGRPVISKERLGLALRLEPAVEAVAAELAAGGRAPLVLPTQPVAPAVPRSVFGPVVVIHRAANRLQLFSGMRLVKTFGVATGQSAYPTPLGRFQIVVKWRNPWWYPPPSPWAVGEKPTPPGPGNPLGTRWMGLSAPGVGIHGTPKSGSIGYSLSHGCIRMLIPQAEWLFDHVEIGTPVFIVAS